jgi:butyryl-CoA dehydrogenase
MHLRLTDEQEMIRKTAKELATKELEPLAAEIDKSAQIPSKIYQKMASVDLFGILIPPPFGGLGRERLDFMLAAEELSAASASVGWSYVSSVCVGFLILAFGSDEQKKKYLPAMSKGDKIASFGLAEPAGGTNWQMTMQTKAVKDGDYYVINGTKHFVSSASEATVFAVMTRTDPTKGPMGFSTFIIDKDTPGFSIGTIEDKFGLCGDHNGELVFDECSVPKENLLGEEGDGMKIFMANGALDCAGQAAVCVGISQAALDATIKYVKERTVNESKTLANFENVQSTVADMAAVVQAARLLSYSAVLTEVKGEPDPMIFSAAMYCNDVAMDVTAKAVKLYGGFGCTSDYPVGRYFRDAKTMSLQKSSDYVKIIAGKMILDVPLGPPPKADGPPK